MNTNNKKPITMNIKNKEVVMKKIIIIGMVIVASFIGVQSSFAESDAENLTVSVTVGPEFGFTISSNALALESNGTSKSIELYATSNVTKSWEIQISGDELIAGTGSPRFWSTKPSGSALGGTVYTDVDAPFSSSNLLYTSTASENVQSGLLSVGVSAKDLTSQPVGTYSETYVITMTT